MTLADQAHVYCPYLGTAIAPENANVDHVIPLSLGGCDAFTVRADRHANSTLGSKIESKLANDFYILMDRNRFDVRGHSGQRPVPTFTAKLGASELPVRLEIDRHERELRVHHLRERRDLAADEYPGERMVFEAKVNMELPLQFVAKVGLAAGYLAYGDAFVSAVQHGALRDVMNDAHAGKSEDALKLVDVCASDRLRKPEREPDYVFWFRLATERLGRSAVVLVPLHGRFNVAVGCLGKVLGWLSVRCDTAQLTNDGEYRAGHVFGVLADGTLQRGSWEKAVAVLKKHVANADALRASTRTGGNDAT